MRRLLDGVGSSMMPEAFCGPVAYSKFVQLRVTSAVPGRVQFELDIKKEHTVWI